MPKHPIHPPLNTPIPIRPDATEPLLPDTLLPDTPANPELSQADAIAAAEAVLDDGDGQLVNPDGNISVDELVAAYGAATLRAEKFQQIIIKQANEIQRLRATLRNVITAQKK